MDDLFRPRHEAARSLYDAFQLEAEHRPFRSIEEAWREERLAVWRAARDYAQQFDKPVPTLEQIESAERLGYGHVDYGAKWAYAVAKLLR